MRRCEQNEFASIREPNPECRVAALVADDVVAANVANCADTIDNSASACDRSHDAIPPLKGAGIGAAVSIDVGIQEREKRDHSGVVDVKRIRSCTSRPQAHKVSAAGCRIADNGNAMQLGSDLNERAELGGVKRRAREECHVATGVLPARDHRVLQPLSTRRLIGRRDTHPSRSKRDLVKVVGTPADPRDDRRT
jgi:hypothetical protein